MDKKLRLYEVFGEIGAKHVQESLKVSYVLRSSALHAARYVVCFRLGDRGRAKSMERWMLEPQGRGIGGKLKIQGFLTTFLLFKP